MTSRRLRPSPCFGCMETVRIAGESLSSEREALRLAWQNGLLRAAHEGLMTLDEHRQCMADDEDEIVELRKLLEAARAELDSQRQEKAT